MKRLAIRTIVAGVALVAAAACAGDPTESLRTGPSILSLNPNLMFIDQGATKGFEVTVRDQQLNPVPLAVNVASNNTAVFTVAPDTTVPSADGARFTFIVTAVGPGQGKLMVTAGGLTDSANVTVLPASFNGVFSTTTPKGGDTVTIASTALLKFDTAAVTVTCECGGIATILFKSRDTLRVLAPFEPAGPWIITGIEVTYLPGLVVTLPTATVTQTGDLWAGASSWQTAPNLSAFLPAVGTSRRMTVGAGAINNEVCPEVVLGFGSTGPCLMFRFDLADTMTIRFRADWQGTTTTDIDVYICADSVVADFGTNCFEDGGAGATGAKPQTTGPSNTLAAGTHWFVIELYGGPEPANNYVTILRP